MTNRDNPRLMIGELYPYCSKNTTVPENFFFPEKRNHPLAPDGGKG